jgi:ribosomal protein L36
MERRSMKHRLTNCWLIRRHVSISLDSA